MNDSPHIGGAKYTRMQYVWRRQSGGTKVRTGCFVAVFHPNPYTFNVSADIGWSLANLGAGDSFYTDQGFRMAAYRAYRSAVTDFLPPSMILAAMFFATSVARDCVRMGVSLRKRNMQLADELGDDGHPYPLYVNVHGLVPNCSVGVEPRDVTFGPQDMVELFTIDRKISTWKIPSGSMDLPFSLGIPIGPFPLPLAGDDRVRSTARLPFTVWGSHMACIYWDCDLLKGMNGALETRSRLLQGMLDRLDICSTTRQASVGTIEKYINPLQLFT